MAKKGAYKEYEPIIRKAKEWPVYLLSKHREEFIQEVAEIAFQQVLHLRSGKAALREEIETTMFREKLRIKRNPWKVDPEDEKDFWDEVKNKLVDSASKQSDEQEKKILREIINRYSHEISGNFKPSRHRMARSIITAGLRRLLNAAKLRTITGAFNGKHTLKDNIVIKGEVEQLRSLAQKGTIVMVPTHFSNLDSVLMGWIIYELGLPPFIYGAGLNLFNIGIFAYFMNSLGAYKVDRRKKNLIYLETLKTYSTLAIQKGAHSLFFPGGTRSRSGKIEKQLKMGLLGTAIEAQRKSFQMAEEFGDDQPQKVFVVPVTLNYNFVLEAPVLIRQYLERKGQERYYFEMDKYSTSTKIIKFLLKFFTKDSKISVSIGTGLDLFGNYVDLKGNSIDKHGNIIDTREYFMTDGRITEDPQREREYTRMLGEVIVNEFHRINYVFASQLVAFVSFQMWRKLHQSLDLYNFFRIHEDDLFIPYEDFRKTYGIVLERLHALVELGKVNLEDDLLTDLDTSINYGLANVGMYHTKRALLKNKKGQIVTQDLPTLYYYHNHLDGYGLEKYL